MRRIATISAIAMMALLTVTMPADAAAGDDLKLEVRVDDQRLAAERFRLDPDGPADIALRVRNNGDREVDVRTVRLTGTALGLTFFAYDTSVALTVPPGETATQRFSLDLTDLDGQVTGLLPARVALLDPERRVLAEQRSTADVEGSLVSVYGVFGIAVLLMTALSWGAALYALGRQRLPANRWRRALRFLPAGVGSGLTAVITLSVLRLVAPSPIAEIPLVLAAAAVAFALGYLTPNPDEDDVDAGAPGAEAVHETPTATLAQGGVA
jgi:hypothetical protein